MAKIMRIIEDIGSHNQKFCVWIWVYQKRPSAMIQKIINGMKAFLSGCNWLISS